MFCHLIKGGRTPATGAFHFASPLCMSHSRIYHEIIIRGASVGLKWADSWNSSVWKDAANNTEDLLDDGKSLFNHPVEDPFAWHSNGSFHLLAHGFRMGMVNATAPQRGDAYGVYARAQSPFGPWIFQEAAVAYGNEMKFDDGSTIVLQRRERPHLLLGEDGAPLFLYNGVCPFGNVYGKGGTQPNHCFTTVQKIKSP